MGEREKKSEKGEMREGEEERPTEGHLVSVCLEDFVPVSSCLVFVSISIMNRTYSWCFEPTDVNEEASVAMHMSLTLRLVRGPGEHTASEASGIPRESRGISSGGRDIPRAATRTPAIAS